MALPEGDHVIVYCFGGVTVIGLVRWVTEYRRKKRKQLRCNEGVDYFPSVFQRVRLFIFYSPGVFEIFFFLYFVHITFAIQSTNEILPSATV